MKHLLFISLLFVACDSKVEAQNGINDRTDSLLVGGSVGSFVGFKIFSTSADSLDYNKIPVKMTITNHHVHLNKIFKVTVGDINADYLTIDTSNNVVITDSAKVIKILLFSILNQYKKQL